MIQLSLLENLLIYVFMMLTISTIIYAHNYHSRNKKMVPIKRVFVIWLFTPIWLLIILEASLVVLLIEDEWQEKKEAFIDMWKYYFKIHTGIDYEK